MWLGLSHPRDLLLLLQMLNEVNARRINDELNVFEGIHKSPIFIGVLLVTAGLQVRLAAAAAACAGTGWLLIMTSLAFAFAAACRLLCW